MLNCGVPLPNEQVQLLYGQVHLGDGDVCRVYRDSLPLEYLTKVVQNSFLDLLLCKHNFICCVINSTYIASRLYLAFQEGPEFLPARVSLEKLGSESVTALQLNISNAVSDLCLQTVKLLLQSLCLCRIGVQLCTVEVQSKSSLGFDQDDDTQCPTRESKGHFNTQL